MVMLSAGFLQAEQAVFLGIAGGFCSYDIHGRTPVRFHNVVYLNSQRK